MTNVDKLSLYVAREFLYIGIINSNGEISVSFNRILSDNYIEPTANNKKANEPVKDCHDRVGDNWHCPGRQESFDSD